MCVCVCLFCPNAHFSTFSLSVSLTHTTQLGDDEICRTPRLKRTLEPVWQGVSAIETVQDKHTEKLVFTCLDHDAFSKDDLIGVIEMSLADLAETTGEPTW